jgi:demethylmenaquinone methyltransferase/2-methoxy-6-polyprenyl-1,4-benzoquinol methylase
LLTSTTEIVDTTDSLEPDEGLDAGSIGAPQVNPDATLTGVTKRRYVRGMFARISARYDLMNFIMSFGQDGRWRRETVRLALAGRSTIGGALALDVGAGTGLIAQEIARRGVPSVAVDLTPDMMAAGRARGVGRGEKVSFVAGDALRLPFAADTFSCITTGFMLRNVTDIEASFAEMGRVLKPGGRLVCLEVGRPGIAPARIFHKLYTRRVVPLLGRVIAGDADAYRYLPSSMGRFPAPPDLARMMARSGLKGVRFKQMSFGAVALHWGTKK